MNDSSKSGSSVKFDAFISYRHTLHDSHTASMLQRALEHYRIPKKIRKTIGTERISRIFRDHEELNTTEDLSTEIEAAIRASRYLIVICSPKAKESEWVNREINLFLQTHDHSHILAVLADGEPEDAFPDALLHKTVTSTDENGNEITETVTLEPLAADLRSTSNFDLYKKLRTEKIRLAATILGCRYDDLKQRDNEYHLRRRIIVTAAVAIGTITAMGYVIQKNATLQRQYNELQISEAKNLAKTSGELFSENDRISAIKVALAALPDSTSPSKPVTNDAIYALNNAMYSYNYSNFINLAPKENIPLSGPFTNVSPVLDSFSPSGHTYALVDATGVLHICNMDASSETLQLTSYHLNKDDDTSFFAVKMISDDEFIAASGSYLTCYDIKDRSVKWQTGETAMFSYYGSYNIRLAAVDSNSVLLCTDGNTILTYDISSGKRLDKQSINDYPDSCYSSCNDIAVSPSGELAAIGNSVYVISSDNVPSSFTRIYVYDARTKTVKRIDHSFIDVQKLAFADEEHIASVEYSSVSLNYGMDTMLDYAVNCYDVKSNKFIWSKNGNTALNLSSATSIISQKETVFGESLPLYAVGVGKDLIIISPDESEYQMIHLESTISGISFYDSSRILVSLKSGNVGVLSLSYGIVSEIIENDNLSIMNFKYDRTVGKAILMQYNSDNLIIYDNVNDDSISLLDTDSYPGKTVSEDTADYFGCRNTDDAFIKSMASRKSVPDSEAHETGLIGNLFVGYLTDNNDDSITYRYAVRNAGTKETSTLFLWKPGETKPLVCLSLDDLRTSYLPSADSSPVLYIIDNVLYYETFGYNASDELHAYDFSAGKELWMQKIAQDGKDYTEAPAVATIGCYQKGIYAFYFKGKALGLQRLDTRQWLLPYTENFAPDEIVDAGVNLSCKNAIVVLKKDDQYYIRLFDITTGKWKESLGKDGYASNMSILLGAKKDVAAYYQYPNIILLDTDTMKVISRIPFSGQKKCDFHFLNNDNALLMFDDTGYLKVWDFNKSEIVGEDKYCYPETISIKTDVNGTWFGITETKDLNSRPYAVKMHIYLLNDNGSFDRIIDIPCYNASFTAGEAIYTDPYGTLGILKIKSLDDVIAEANKLLNGRTFTELEKKKYNINN